MKLSERSKFMTADLLFEVFEALGCEWKTFMTWLQEENPLTYIQKEDGGRVYSFKGKTITSVLHEFQLWDQAREEGWEEIVSAGEEQIRNMTLEELADDLSDTLKNMED